jgi:hypothetical protein
VSLAQLVDRNSPHKYFSISQSIYPKKKNVTQKKLSAFC